MQRNFQIQVRNYLRKQGFNVTHSGVTLSFNNYTIVFDSALDYCTVYNPFCKGFYISIPYSSPANLLAKIRDLFFQKIPSELKHSHAEKAINQALKSPLLQKFSHSIINKN